nr:retrovirus-related Pol polyprotein from transposon TNT 1-94 [Tanacetum cinerariifolium]
MNSNSNGLSSTGIDNTKTRRPQPRSNTKNDRVLSASKSSRSKNKEVKVEEHHRNLLFSKKNKHSSSACNNSKIDSHDVISKVVCAKCLPKFKYHKEHLFPSCEQGKSKRASHPPKPVPNSRQILHLIHMDLCGPMRIASINEKRYVLVIVDDYSRYTWVHFLRSKDEAPEVIIKFLKRVTKFIGTVRFENYHVAAILGFGDLQWGNILITRVYFVEGLGHNLFSVGQFCDSDLEVAFRRNACFVRNLDGVDLLKRDRSTNLYTNNLHEMASISPICLMARASSTKSWLWHQRLSHLNFDTIIDLARNDLVAGFQSSNIIRNIFFRLVSKEKAKEHLIYQSQLQIRGRDYIFFIWICLPKFKYHKEHLCPSCEHGKSKRASHIPKPVPNSRQRLHLLHMDLCGPMRIASINGKRYVLVIVDDYSRYTWVHFLRSKDEAPEEAAKFVEEFKSLATEADASLAKHKALELEIERLLKAVVSQDIMHIVQKESVIDTSDLQTVLERVYNTKTRRPQPRSNTKHDRDVISKVVCAMCKKCLISINHDKCLHNYVNGKNSRDKKQKAKASFKEKQMKYQPKVTKPKKVGTHERLATPKPRKSRLLLRWSPTGRLFDQEGKIVDSSESKSYSDFFMVRRFGLFQAYDKKSKASHNFVWKFMGTVRLKNDHVAAILGFEVAFRRNACFVINLEGVDLLKGDRSTNLYTINLYEMASASPICLMARASSTKSILWHQRLSYLNFDTINDLARNDLVSGLPKFKYNKERLCPSCKQGKSKRTSHPPKPVSNSRQRLHLLHMDLCGPMRIASINGKWYVLVIVDDYSRYTWVHFLRSKDEAPEVIITFLKRITVLLQSPVIIIRTDNGTSFKNQVLKEYFDTVSISYQMSSIQTPQQKGVVEQRNWTLVEVARIMLIFSRAPLFLWAEAIATACFTQNRSIIYRRFNKIPYELINGRKPDISFLYVFSALCYPKNDREDIGKLGAKGDIGFFIGYSANSCAYRIYNRRTKKIMETMNVSFDELLVMAFEQRSSKPGLHSMTSGQIISGLDLTYAPSTITTQQPTEG